MPKLKSKLPIMPKLMAQTPQSCSRWPNHAEVKVKVKVDVANHAKVEVNGLSWESRQHVGNTLATCPNVAHFGQKVHVGATRISPLHRQFASITADIVK